MQSARRKKLTAYVNLLHRHRGEAEGAYDEVAAVYDSFTQVWDQHIAAPALTYLNTLLTQWVRPGAGVLARLCTFLQTGVALCLEQAR